MSPEGTAICLFIAFVAFLVGAVFSWARADRPGPEFFISGGLAAWVLVPLWEAVKAI